VDDTLAKQPTRALVHLDHLTHNMQLLQELVGKRPLWPAIKANAYGHDATLVARHLIGLGYGTLCVARAAEAVALREAGVRATLILLSASLPEESECIAEHDLESVVCTAEAVDALARAAARAGKRIAVHVKVDTGMGRIGIRPDEVAALLERCRSLPALRLRGLMSHFPRADEADKTFSREQMRVFAGVCEEASRFAPLVRHLANSAAIFDLPESHLDAARPGIAIYGLSPSPQISSRRVRELRPVLEWRTRISFLKEVAAGTGLSYGHTFHAERPSLIATLPVGYGDGLSRRLSNDLEVLVHGSRCPLVGTITMDQSLVDVTALRGRVSLGDEVCLLGRQGDAEVTADEWAGRLGTINYEIVTAISRRVPRIGVSEDPRAAPESSYG
jgi:alanine racemase